MDLVGVFTVAFITAFGGGTLRDILLDKRPLFWVTHQEYAILIFVLALVATPLIRTLRQIVSERLIVIADAVNPLRITREAWRRSAANAGSPIIEVEIVCSDRAEHRRRVETRSIDIDGLAAPSWQAVIERSYEPWDRPPIVIDTAGRTPARSLADLRGKLPAAASVRPPR